MFNNGLKIFILCYLWHGAEGHHTKWWGLCGCNPAIYIKILVGTYEMTSLMIFVFYQFGVPSPPPEQQIANGCFYVFKLCFLDTTSRVCKNWSYNFFLKHKMSHGNDTFSADFSCVNTTTISHQKLQSKICWLKIIRETFFPPGYIFFLSP